VSGLPLGPTRLNALGQLFHFSVTDEDDLCEFETFANSDLAPLVKHLCLGDCFITSLYKFKPLESPHPNANSSPIEEDQEWHVREAHERSNRPLTCYQKPFR
jgi:hypothetical protein